MNEIWKNRRKFGLEYCDLPTMLSNVSMLLRVVTVNIENDYNKGIPIYYYIITIVSTVCYFYVFLFSMAWFVFWRSRVTGDNVAAMIVLSLGVTSEIGTLKLLNMCINMDKIKKIAKDYLACDSQTIPGSRFHVNLMKAQRKVKKRAILYWLVVAGNGLVYLMRPVVLPGRNFPENRYIIYGLEPMFESPNYEIAYFMMIGCVFFTCYIPPSVTAYLIVTAGYTESQIRALSEEMLHVWSNAVKLTAKEMKLDDIDEHEANTRKLINKYVQKRLKEILIRHALIITLFKQLNDVFRSTIAIGFILLIIGLVAELLGQLKNTYIQMPYSFMQIAMDCFTGQRVIDASVMFEQAVYGCQWEKFDKKNMKMVLIIIQNSQKTLELSAGGVATLSFSCLMTIIRLIYSTYTALSSTV